MPVESSLLHFVHAPDFDEGLVDIPMSDEELREVQAAIQRDPRVGVLIEGTGGVRKMRAGVKGRGKRGGARVLYYCVLRRRVVFLLLAYDKSVRESITTSEKHVLRHLTTMLGSEPGDFT